MLVHVYMYNVCILECGECMLMHVCDVCFIECGECIRGFGQAYMLTSGRYGLN